MKVKTEWVHYSLILLVVIAVVATVITFTLIKCNNNVEESHKHPAHNWAWTWECQEGSCVKKPIKNEDNNTTNAATSLSVCQLTCSDGASLWPKPRGDISVTSNKLAQINVNSIHLETAHNNNNNVGPAGDLLRRAMKIFINHIHLKIPRGLSSSGGKSLIIHVDIKDTATASLSLETDESYTLKVDETSDGRIKAIISSATFFGARHALQTLTQLIVYDDLQEMLQMPKEVLITDSPAYPYRGVLLDTSRNYITVDAIKKTLDAMAASKLNTFHWHITDSHSFPFVSKSRPNLWKKGAYSPRKVYTESDIKEIIDYGLERGIRILPEFDAPAHVGEGWQDTGLVTCFNWQPWQDYCVEPPCGQLDPTKDDLYPFLKGIYSDMFDQFKPDIFHMGGDEVNFNCWKSTSNIVKWMKERGWNTTEADFIKLWDHFQSKALQLVYEKAGKQLPVIMWTSTLTKNEYLLKNLPKDKYIIQIWTEGNDGVIQNLLKNGYNVILSNYDALYLDCGFAGWVTDGNNWCSPYIGWQKVYENTPAKIAGPLKNLVLGNEATLWTEQVDSTSVDTRLWPRAAAMAEVLWSEPTTGWEEAEQRFLIHRERLVNIGVNADAIEPEWCLQNEDNCRIGSKFFSNQ